LKLKKVLLESALLAHLGGLMRGDRVLIRAYGGKPLVRRVWNANAKGVFAVPEAEYQLLESGAPLGFIVGFPLNDVFEFEAGIEGGSVDWSQRCPWSGRSD
jgi:hypothetical protein